MKNQLLFVRALRSSDTTTFNIQRNFATRFFKTFLLVVLHFFIPKGYSQISVTQHTPSFLEACYESENFRVVINNNSPSNIDSVLLSVSVPDGFHYASGSLSGSGFFPVDSNLADRQFFVYRNIFAAGDSAFFTFKLENDCEVIGRYSQGFVFHDTVKIIAPFVLQQFVSNGVDVHFPHLVITNIANGNFLGHIGEVFTRTLTIQNSGTSPASNISLYDVNGDSVEVLSSDIGYFDNADPNNIKILLGPGDIPGGVINVNDVLTITETVRLTGCPGNSIVLGTSRFRAGWGCTYGDTCSSTSGIATAAIPNNLPLLHIYSGSDSLNVCYGPDNRNTYREKWFLTSGPFRQGKFKITMYGRGHAYDEIGHLYSNIVPNTFEIRDKNYHLVNHFVTHIESFSIQSYPWHSCTGLDSLIDYIMVEIPWMALTDTFFISYQYQVCSPELYEPCTPPEYAVRPMGHGLTYPQYFNECLNTERDIVDRVDVRPSVAGYYAYGGWRLMCHWILMMILTLMQVSTCLEILCSLNMPGPIIPTADL